MYNRHVWKFCISSSKRDGKFVASEFASLSVRSCVVIEAELSERWQTLV